MYKIIIVQVEYKMVCTVIIDSISTFSEVLGTQNKFGKILVLNGW